MRHVEACLCSVDHLEANFLAVGVVDADAADCRVGAYGYRFLGNRRIYYTLTAESVAISATAPSSGLKSTFESSARLLSSPSPSCP